MAIKGCIKPACQYTDERCKITIVGWDAALCHCPVDGSVVIWGPPNQAVEHGQAGINSCNQCTGLKLDQCGEWCRHYPPAG